MKSRNFRLAIPHLLAAEGGYVHDPRDPGGETKFGISKAAYPNVDIKNLTTAQAEDIYYRDYWQKIKADDMPYQVACVLFDMAVNMGVKQAVKLLQNCIKSPVDGIIGPATMRSLAAKNPMQVCQDLTSARIMFYCGLSGWKFYGTGWTNRSISTLAHALTTQP